MPATLTALAIAAILVPGYVHRMARSRQTPLSPASQLNELLALLTVSLLTLGTACALHEIGRTIWPGSFIDTPEFLKAPSTFWLEHFGAVTWSVVGVLGTAILLAALLGNATPLIEALQSTRSRRGRIGRWAAQLGDRFAPAIVEASAWYRALDVDVPDNCWVHVGCSLRQGGYVSGRLAWFSTDTEEHGDRGLALAPPIEWIRHGQPTDTSLTGRLVLSACEIALLEVTYRSDPPT